MKLQLTLHTNQGPICIEGDCLPAKDPVRPPSNRIDLPPETRTVLRSAAERCREAIEAYKDLGTRGIVMHLGGSRRYEILGEPFRISRLSGLCVAMRVFFLNDDPLCFYKLLKSVTDGRPELKLWGKSLKEHWVNSAFGYAGSHTAGGVEMKADLVISAWFNSRLFHTAPDKADAFRFEQLVEKLGGEEAAKAHLLMNLDERLKLVVRFLAEVANLDAAFGAMYDEVFGV